MELGVMLVNLIAVAAIITGLACAIWWWIGLYAVHSRRAEQESPELDPTLAPPGKIPGGIARVPLVLIIFYVATVLWMAGYMLFVWIAKVTY